MNIGADGPAAAETTWRDGSDFVLFYRYPKVRWVHVRTSNPVEPNSAVGMSRWSSE
jgi:hypothetical protein